MEVDGANLNTETNSGKKQQNDSSLINHDIRSFFNKSSTQNAPSTITTNKRIIKVIQPYLNEIDENTYKLRERKIVNYKHRFEPSEDEDENSQKSNLRKKIKIRLTEKDSFNEDEINSQLTENQSNSEEYDLQNTGLLLKKKNKKKSNNKTRKLSKKSKTKKMRKLSDSDEDNEVNTSEDFSSNEVDDSDIEYIELSGLKSYKKLKIEAYKLINDAESEMKKLTREFYMNEQKIAETKSKYPNLCIPISADIREFKFKLLAEKQAEITGKLFDVIMMDPPWQLSSSQPTRGVAIAYDTLNDNIITDIPVEKLQTDGFIFIWTINAKFKVTLDLLKTWGYKYCDDIVWVKQTVNGKIAKGHGYYLQHTKETCIIGVKGNPSFNKNVFGDVIFSKRRGQSQKPEEIYEYIERLIPNGYYLEIFGRRNNLRDYWVTIGNEI